ncbi:hypothetical protein E3P99_03491 [Wallemia hederae]|uniref:Endoplasmic reticulum junction formation protein lunapark n=1 Tax=Wallemia hederae TaxID=1540922 RepID=A0A4T0FG15_9BASI|nr:hypothetical protein E3P99_03491 [Wallemia hederae]
MLSSLFRRRNKNSDFESTLNGLSSEMIEHQAKLADIRTRERRATLWITTTLFLLWGVYVAFWYLGLVDWLVGGGEGGLYKLVAWVGVVVGPLMMLFARRIAQSWYTRIGSREETRLRHLHTSLVKTLEEVKLKAPYNEARSLLERYGPSVGMTPHDVTPMTPQSTPMKARHATTPAAVTTPSQAAKQLPQTPLPQTPSQIAHMNKMQPQIPAPAPHSPHTPQSPQTPVKETAATPAQHQQHHQHPNPIPSPSPIRQRTWYDRVADAILGDDPTSTSGDISQRYALICEKCAKHNGLVPREQYIDLQWECRFCQQMNLSPRRKALARQLQGGGTSGASTRKPSPLSQQSAQSSRLGEESVRVDQGGEEEKGEKGDKTASTTQPLPVPDKS